jgi:hypothetical protein
MDPPWLDVVRERSQFLFLQLWTHKDWQLNARPFASLTITAIVIEKERIRKLCLAGMLVGGAGLAIALIASLVGPVAILVQGQAWRWVWIASFVSVLLLAPTVLRIWQDKKCGPICAILLVSGWTLSAVDGTTCVALALILWTLRAHITCPTTRYLRWAAVVLVIVIVTWVVANSWTILSTTAAESGREPLLLQRIKNILGLQIPAVLIVWFLWRRMTRSRSLWVPTLMGGALLASSACILPWSFKQSRWIGSPSEISEFADWTRVIPPTSSVFVAPTHDTGAFVWFTLGRPNYLSISQSAGVVFSRATALEVARRSQVLLPLVDPSWKIMTGTPRTGAGNQEASRSPFRPLTKKSLISVCNDPQLGFVISPENVGFDPVPHTRAGAWKEWNLYDCRHVRSLSAAT